ncbi:MAG: hypothetical protein NTV97_33050 [Alphaproteobacteria bacterium]|nr:hypothetical protein [Alphaproteobacteria bacterium]
MAAMSKLDDASWHDTATHIGLFVAWTIMNDLWKGEASQAAAVTKVRRRSMTGQQFLLQQCDGKLTSGDLTAKGAGFAESYYPKQYIKDYRRLLVGKQATDYAVEDTWENYHRLAEAIDKHWRKHQAERG